jgi:2,3,4,5-tetrahydropyridine-2-carboxylate N-succinyltransferase
MHELQTIVEKHFEQRNSITPKNAPAELLIAIEEIFNKLDTGSIRVAEKSNNEWIVHEWIKKAVLLYFRVYDNQIMHAGFTNYFDKVPTKYEQATADSFKESSIRIVPPACIRKGTYIGKNTVLLPSFVNVGAYVGNGCMIDTWATVGSCAQIGNNVHISGGTGIGGVLEPLQAKPTIIEDNCFIGARSEIVEGVIVGEGSVIAMGVFIGQSTKIYDRENGEILYGKVPAGSVVVPGNLPSKDGNYSTYCAIIVKKVDAKTRAKVGINELLHIVD